MIIGTSSTDSGIIVIHFDQGIYINFFFGSRKVDSFEEANLYYALMMVFYSTGGRAESVFMILYQ